jgi:hypothetical protein
MLLYGTSVGLARRRFGRLFPFLPEFLQLCVHGIFVVFAKPKHNRNGRDDLPVFLAVSLPLSESSVNNSFSGRTSICKRMSDLR